MILTDTHTHLYTEQFHGTLDSLMKEAIDLDIKRFFMPNIDAKSVSTLTEVYHKFSSNTFPMLGLHPTSVNVNYLDEMTQIFAHLDQIPCVAIGEIGIDLYWDKTFLKQQQEAFIYQIRLAKSLQLPIVIHARDAFDEIFEIVKAENDENLKGIFHCFTGEKEHLDTILSFGGFKVGIGGVFTFKKSNLAELIKDYPLKHFVLETDAPYLAPHPFRGKMNQPAYLIYVAQKMADIFEISLDELANITTANSKEIFGI